MVLSWEQATGLLYSSGDVQRISLWDTHKELKIQVVCGWGSLPHTAFFSNFSPSKLLFVLIISPGG